MQTIEEERPISVPYAGGRVFIAVHDQEHFRARKRWRARLAESHARANHGGKTHWFRRIKRLYDQWRHSEQAWYAQYGLCVPRGFSVPEEPVRPIVRTSPPRLAERCPRTCTICAQSDGARISRYLEAYPDAMRSDIVAAHPDIAPVTVDWCHSYIRRTGGVRVDCKNCQLLTLLADQQFHCYADIWNVLGTTCDAGHSIIKRLRCSGYSFRSLRFGCVRGMQWSHNGISPNL